MMNEIEDKTIVFFDGDCGLCSQVVRFLINRDQHHVLYFAPLQGEVSRHFLNLESETYNTIYLRQDGQLYSKSTAALKAISRIGGIWSFCKVLLIIPAFLRDYIYDVISRNRKTLVKEICSMPTENQKARLLK